MTTGGAVFYPSLQRIGPVQLLPSLDNVCGMSQLSKVRAEHEKSGLLEENQIEEEEASVLNEPLEASRPRFRPECEDIVVVHNVQKTYLLGIEGVAALRLRRLMSTKGFCRLRCTSGVCR